MVTQLTLYVNTKKPSINGFKVYGLTFVKCVGNIDCMKKQEMEMQTVTGNTITPLATANWQVVLAALKTSLVSDSAYVIVTRVPIPPISNKFEKPETVVS